MCGDDINSRAQAIVELKLKEQKHQSKDVMIKTKDDGPNSQMNDKTDVSSQKFNELQREFEETKQELQSELEASKQVNIILLTEI